MDDRLTDGGDEHPSDDDASTVPLNAPGQETDGSGDEATHLLSDSADPLDPLIGAQLGNLQVLSILGRGGFGSVYRARDIKLGRTVALKFLTQPLETRHKELFEREARAIAFLSKHAGIVDIYEWGEYEGRCYFALEYVESNAADLLKEHPNGIPAPRALSVARDCADALAYAHGRGILHRDVKPANILIDLPDGEVKIADFGLARFRETGDVTVSGNVSGSPPYMSPEQVSGERLDERSDIFSMGVTLHEFLCGQRLFGGNTALETMSRIRDDNRTPPAPAASRSAGICVPPGREGNGPTTPATDSRPPKISVKLCPGSSPSMARVPKEPLPPRRLKKGRATVSWGHSWRWRPSAS